jgi:hypothetical protein
VFVCVSVCRADLDGSALKSKSQFSKQKKTFKVQVKSTCIYSIYVYVRVCVCVYMYVCLSVFVCMCASASVCIQHQIGWAGPDGHAWICMSVCV